MTIDTAAVQATLGTAWKLLLALGIMTLLLGAAVLFWPEATLLVLAVLFGFWLILGGVLRVIGAVGDKLLPTGLRVLYGALGVALVVAGGYALVNPDQSLGALLFLIGFFFIVDGIYDVIAAVTNRVLVGSRWWVALSGALGILAGFILLTRPNVGLVVLVALTGAMLLMLGLVRVMGALALRDVAQQVSTAGGR
jgi:uncharacterized membrane protein HdeD (DUF308 family)